MAKRQMKSGRMRRKEMQLRRASKRAALLAAEQRAYNERVAKERQKPLFAELSDTKLPQVDLLDAAPGRVESVSAESLARAWPYLPRMLHEKTLVFWERPGAAEGAELALVPRAEIERLAQPVRIRKAA